MPPSRAKTKVACQACNSRRVKCDRTEQIACTNCRLSGKDCQPIVSRRGKHKRINGSRSTGESARRSARRQPTEDGLDDCLPGVSTTLDDVPLRASHQSREDSIPIQESTSSSMDTEHRVVYYGDSYNLKLIALEWGDAVDGVPLEKPWDDATENLHLNRIGEHTRSRIHDHGRRERTRLRELGVFDAIDKPISDKLVQTYFENFYPTCPTIDRADFRLKYESGNASQLLLQAIYFVAVAHGGDTLYKEAGFSSRYLAAFTFYQRAKALYDANQEPDAIATLQAVHLLSHWGDKPEEQKDLWHWIGIAVSLAQALGLHRSNSYATLNERHQRVYKRIWWTIYNYDIHLAMAFGRTPHINDAYCSVSALSEEDFENEGDDRLGDFSLYGKPTRESQLYLIHSSTLFCQVSKCLVETYGVGADEATSRSSLDCLLRWKASLPPILQEDALTTSEAGSVLVPLLHLDYHTSQILLRRNSSNNPSRMASGTVPFDAAVKNIRILENLLESGYIYTSPIRILSATFSSLTVQMANMRGCSPDIEEISKHRARFCMLILTRLQDHWPPLLWYYRLFLRILHHLGCKIQEEIMPSHTQSGLQPKMIESGQASNETEDVSQEYMRDTIGEITHDQGGMSEMIRPFPISAFLEESLTQELASLFDLDPQTFS